MPFLGCLRRKFLIGPPLVRGPRWYFLICCPKMLHECEVIKDHMIFLSTSKSPTIHNYMGPPSWRLILPKDPSIFTRAHVIHNYKTLKCVIKYIFPSINLSSFSELRVSTNTKFLDFWAVFNILVSRGPSSINPAHKPGPPQWGPMKGHFARQKKQQKRPRAPCKNICGASANTLRVEVPHNL